MTPSPSPDIPRVADHELLRLIGKGSYGEVWLARNIMGVWRAVKVVTRGSFDSLRPFERELAGIQRYEPISRTGEGLVPILHVGHLAENGFFYVMELADAAMPSPGEQPGEEDFDPDAYQPRTLRSDLKRLGRLPIEECVELGLDLCSGLGSMHKHGLVHRDIKPANIVFVRGRAKLADVGLVGEIRAARTFVGTEGYIPPEGPGAPGADFFALGKVLYEAATGLSPEEFPNPPADWLTGEIPHGALDLHEIILRSCESDPERRYQKAAEMQADLALMQSGRSVRAARRLERRVRTFRRIGAAAALAALIATSLGLFAAYRARVEVKNVQTANLLRRRAESAEMEARSQLAEAQLANAGLERRTGQAGQRGRALELLRSAALYHTNRMELRSETVAALALADLSEVTRGSPSGAFTTQSHPLAPRERDLLAGPRGHWCTLDEELTYYTRAHEDGSVRIHRWNDDSEIAILEGIQANRATVAPFSRTGDRVAGQSGANAFVWETKTGRRIFERVVPSLAAVDLTPDGEWVALRSIRGILRLYRVADGTPGTEIDLGSSDGPFWFSPDGRELAAFGGGFCGIQRFEVATGKKLERITLPFGICPTGSGAYWSPDSRGLLIAGNDFCGYCVRLDAPGHKLIRLEGHSAEIAAAAFHPTRPFVLTSSWDGSGRLWDLRTGRMLARLPRWGFEARWSRNNRIGWLEYGGAGRFRLAEFQMFEPEGVRLLAEPIPMDSLGSHKGPWHGTFVADGLAFGVATYDGVRLWGDEEAAPLFVNLGPTRWLQRAANGHLWASAASGLFELPVEWSQTEHRLSVRLGEVRREFAGGQWALSPQRGEPGMRAGYGHHYVVAHESGLQRLGTFEGFTTFMTTSPDGRWVLSGAQSESGLNLWRTEPWTLIRQVPGRLSAEAVFTSDGRSFITSSSGEARRERVEDGQREWTFRPPGASTIGIAVALSPDDSLAAITIGSNEAALVDARTGELLIQFRPIETGLISGLVFSPNGQRLAVLTQNHFIHLWDLGFLRARLREIKLDWDATAQPSAPAPRPPAISLRLVPSKI